MGKVYSIVSVKGGTGKTTTSVNIGMALAKEGLRTLVFDANLEGSNVAFHLGLSTHDIATIHDVLRGKCTPTEAIYTHPSGMNLMLGGVYLEDMELRDEELNKVINKIKGEFDFVIVDCSSGLNGSVRSAIKNSDEIIIVTNPELPAVVDAFKIVQFCENSNIFIRGVVINKCAKNSDLSPIDVETILGRPVLGVVPEDSYVKGAMKERLPIVAYKPKRKSAREFKNVAYSISGLNKKANTTFWEKVFNTLNRTNVIK
ncbi:MAG: AAA family ATPase [Candidatus Nanoarchaeia archaeon]|jgi:septum site-determining protein MinD